MIRKGFVMEPKPGKIAEYEQTHNPIPDSLYQVLKQHGLKKYSIFHDSRRNLLFGYLEIEDEGVFSRLSENEVCKKWWKRMTEYLVCDRQGADKAIEDELREVFYID